MRVMLLLVLVNGLVPQLGETVEDIAHYARTGHVAHCAEDAGAPCDGGREHGCSDTQHHCICCPGMPVLAVQAERTAVQGENASDVPPTVVGNANARSLEPPYRPPIA